MRHQGGRLGDHDLVMRTLHRYFDDYDLSTVDSVVLGCTHFVFFRRHFRELLDPRTAIIDGNEGTARHLGEVLAERDELAPDDQSGSVNVGNSDRSPAVAALSRSLLEESDEGEAVGTNDSIH